MHKTLMQELTAQLPKLPEIRDVVNKTLLPRLEGLGVIVKQASDAALQATAAANQGGLQTLAGLLNGLVNVLVQGQLQVGDIGLMYLSTRAQDHAGQGFH